MSRSFTKAILVAAFVGALHGQTLMRSYTVLSLPSAAANNGVTIWVTNGASATDCTVGGGTYLVPCKSNGTSYSVQATAGGITYPGAGIAVSTGSAWGSSLTVGTSAGNLVQLNGSGQLPSVSAALLTNFPTLNQNTTGNAATASSVPATGITGTLIPSQLPTATGSTLGISRPDGTTISITGGVLSAIGGSAFSALTGGTNTTAAMVIGTGASLGVSGSGTNNATSIGGITITGTPSSGYVPTATSSSTATWQAATGGSAFSAITSGTNATASMVLGTGSSLTFSGSGTNNASSVQGVAISGTPVLGYIPVATSGTAATWQVQPGSIAGPSSCLQFYPSGGLSAGQVDIVTTCIPRLSAANTFSGVNIMQQLRLAATTYAGLPLACTSGAGGQLAYITDSTTQTWGAAVTVGGGTFRAALLCDGSVPNWTVFGTAAGSGGTPGPPGDDGVSLAIVSKKISSTIGGTVYVAGAVTYSGGTYTAAAGAQSCPSTLIYGQIFSIVFNQANPGAANLTVCTLPSKSIRVLSASGSALTLIGGEIVAGASLVLYDGTQFIYEGPVSVSSAISSATTVALSDFTGQTSFYLTAGATLTLPCAAAVSPNGRIFVFSNSGTATISRGGSCSSDVINLNGTTGNSQTIAQGVALTQIVTDGSTNFYLSGGASGGTQPIILADYTVSTLPTCSSYTRGFASVHDATSPTYNGTLTGGGTVTVPVFCNGTNWVSH